MAHGDIPASGNKRIGDDPMNPTKVPHHSEIYGMIFKRSYRTADIGTGVYYIEFLLFTGSVERRALE
jgi:hypothetical protein